MFVNIVTKCPNIVLEAHELFFRLRWLVVLSEVLVVIVSLVIVMMLVVMVWCMMHGMVIVVVGPVTGAQLGCLIVALHRVQYILFDLFEASSCCCCFDNSGRQKDQADTWSSSREAC